MVPFYRKQALYFTFPTGARENSKSAAAQAARFLTLPTRLYDYFHPVRRLAPLGCYIENILKFLNFLTHFKALPDWNSTVK